MNRVAIIESLLFVAGDEGLTLEQLTKLVNIKDEEIEELINHLIQRYNENDESGITLIKTAKRYKLVTKDKCAKYIKKYAQSPFSQTLSRALLETLAIIAYKQPITRIEIEDIRGVQVTGNLQKLKSFQLIDEVGRIDKPGRPLLYGTTDFFLDYFGINNLKDLPELKDKNNEKEIKSLFSDDYEWKIKLN